MMKEFFSALSSPGAEFRGAPFWAWNAKLEPEELRRQIRIMKEMGLGGFFMHSRVGLGTKYLGTEWFDCIRACIDEAREQGMLAWLYDEDRWPSGAAGGLVTADEKYRMRMMAMEVLESAGQASRETYDAVFAAVLRENRLYGVRRLASPDEPLRDGEKIFAFFEQASSPSSWYNDQTYLDTMNEDAVKKFLETTHEVYAREVGSGFGGVVPGIFTDEPNYFHVTGSFKFLPWTGSVPVRFRDEYGYDIMTHLPELFYIVDDREFAGVRRDYHNLLTALFVGAFSKQIGEWCDRHNALMTGHVLLEDTLLGQTRVVGAAMRFYEYMQAPGIDLLTEHWNVFDTAKQCTSVARQFGRRWRLTETYGCTGWDFPFAGHKALGDWQYALGLNLRCQHLAWYSMAAEAKRDYPASISWQSPWYREYPVVEDYFARLGAALSDGREICDLLVVHPIESAWGVFAVESISPEAAEAEDLTLIQASNGLLGANLDFDYGDEELMSRHASVDGGMFKLNLSSYRAVLLPQMRTIRESTLKLLAEFRNAGGTVVYIGEPPAYMDGRVSETPAAVYADFVQGTIETMAELLSPQVRRVSITGPDGAEIEPLLHVFRQSEELGTLFICNTSMNMTKTIQTAPLVRDRQLNYPQARVAWQADPQARIFELELESGKIRPVTSRCADGVHQFETSFEVLGSRLFFASREDIANAPALPAVDVKELTAAALDGGPWQITLDEPNVLVLDHARWRTGAGELSPPEYIIKIDDQVREKLGVRPRGGAMVQPWMRGEQTATEHLELTLEYTFECGTVPVEPCRLGIERPDLYRISLNGHDVSPEDDGEWCDRSLRTLRLPADSFRPGVNTLVLECRYHEFLPGLEAVFILGDFGVSGNCLTQSPETLEIGDWCAQGLQNYAGNVTYSKTFEAKKSAGPLFLDIPEWRGVALGVEVNGSPRQVLAWPPYRLDVSEFVRDGVNRVSITVLGHRRNSHGPFYLNEKWPIWTGPEQFKQYDRSERQLVPCGLLREPELLS
jgi:hypothetical protein